MPKYDRIMQDYELKKYYKEHLHMREYKPFATECLSHVGVSVDEKDTYITLQKMMRLAFNSEYDTLKQIKNATRSKTEKCRTIIVPSAIKVGLIKENAR